MTHAPSLVPGLCICGDRHVAPAVSPLRDPEEGRRLRDEGRDRAYAHSHPAWKAAADRVMADLVSSGREFGAEDVTDVVGLPASRNAVGALFGAWSKRGRIVPVGYKQAERASRHASRQLTWRGVR